ncbi:MAG: TAXI family TRAP transporter solute-binding subunit [Proteobacteria bacterium]|nr:TAXI family TRAP transporter solute-binding subunit [Pseudomonadota bacterium]MBU1451559.1 TAXI family TRAP transporter solute-binding subunit [Pseudomonadota bacterium]MBU2469642.1 TAXI family TRAP transporter solute-binding subunit [Pseudomonadota bacterium]MBU2516770.1 TAXI family TRAP transporter solute-binding subunit [Pseudomonadota bacterium]
MAISALLAMGPAVPVSYAKTDIIRLGTSKEGTIGYSCGVALSATIKRNVKGISMEAVPTPGSTASVKIFARGDLDIAYCSTWTLRDAYNNLGPFAKSPIKRLPLQGWYYLTADWIPVASAKEKDINTYQDMVGKKFYPFVAGSGIYDVYRAVFTGLGIWDKLETRQVGAMEAADALKMGTVDVLGGYCLDKGQTAPSWMRNLDTRTEIKVLRPSKEQMQKIGQLSGITFGKLSNKWMQPKNRKINSGDIYGWSIHYGFHPGNNMSTETMYQIYKTWIEKAKKDLAPVNGTLKFASEHMMDLQVKGLMEAKDIPVHPGVAKYLKEKGLWNNALTIGKLASGVQ